MDIWHVPNEEDDFQLDVELTLYDFMHDNSLKQFIFPPILNSNQRRYIHETCKARGLMSKSNGREPARYLTIYKSDRLDVRKIHELKLSQAAVDAIDNFVQINLGIEQNNFDMFDNFNRSAFGKLNIGLVVTPERPNCNNFKDVRESLPIFTYREEFLEMVGGCQVAGSERTTQVPQYLLESAFVKGERCRVISVQNTELTGLWVSERVAAERGEDVGLCVGYQIKLESKLDPRTGVVFCTADILLRTLMTGESCLVNMTHIVVDEVQERSKLTDFLLVSLRECLRRHPSLRIILLSTNANCGQYTNYFDDEIEVLNVPGGSYKVNEFFLEDVLLMINNELEPMKRHQEVRPMNEVLFNLEEPTVKDMEEALQSCMAGGSKEALPRILRLVVNFADSKYGYTPLIAAAAHGNLCCVRKLIKMANISMRTVNGRTALSWAKHYGQKESTDFLENCAREAPPDEVEESLLTGYNAVLDDEAISNELIVAVIQFVHQSLDRHGTVLVFLPSHEDVANCAERIKEKLDTTSLQICTLYENMPPELQELFVEVPDKRKIVLATKIAETVVTIDRVRFVIDTGFNYEFDYDWELCLKTKMLVPNEIAIAEFLSRAVEPPPGFLVDRAIESLVALGALDEHEQLTSMGRHLEQFSVEPNLGKMLLYATVFKCLDPVLTIVACLSQKDPFVVPSKHALKMQALLKKEVLPFSNLSHHMCLLICFQMWQEAKVHNEEQLSCSSNFVCSATMSAINNVRIQLLGQLPAPESISSFANVEGGSSETHSSYDSRSLSSRNGWVDEGVTFGRLDDRVFQGSYWSSSMASFANQSPRVVELPLGNNVKSNPICKPGQNSLRSEASGGADGNTQRNDLCQPGPSNASTFGGETDLSLNVIAPKEITVNENTLFFIIMPNEVKNVIISVSQSTWKFAPQTEKKLFKYFMEGWMILLLYTVRGTKMFQGVARLMGTNNGVPNRPCAIEWLGTNPVPYARIKHILHPKLHICEDGQEVENDAGRMLTRMLMESPPTLRGIARPVLGAS